MGTNQHSPDVIGTCESCHQPKRLAQLALIFVGGRRKPDPAKAHCHYSNAKPDEVTDTMFALICGPCFVDGITPEVAA